MNNVPNLVSCSKGLLDAIHGFDVKMAGISADSLALFSLESVSGLGKQ